MSEAKAASLTVLGGPLAGLRQVLPESGTLTIGSSPGSGLQLDLPSVSPYHARVVVQEDRVTVHDTGSTRVVHVNDNPLERGGTVLRNGDILWLGPPGEDDVVMLQCILPRRPTASPATVPATPASPALAPPGQATPTPEIETMALWTPSAEAALPPVPRVAAAPVPEEPTGYEETMAIVPESLRDATEDELVVAAEVVTEPEPAVAPAPFVPPLAEVEFEPAAETVPLPPPEAAVEETVEEVDAFVVEDAGVEPSPTLLMTSPDEIAHPEREFSAIEFGETEAFVPELPAPPPPPVAPEEPEPVVSLPEPPPLAAPEPPQVAPHAPPLPPTPPPAPPPRPVARALHPSASTPPPRRDGSLRHATPPPRPAPPPAEAEPDETGAPAESQAGGKHSLVLAAAGFGGVLVLAGLGWLAWRFLAGGPAAPVPTPAAVAQATAPPATEPAPAPTAEAPTPEPLATLLPTPVPTTAATPEPRPTPTPTPRATPTPAAARPTPTPAPAAAGPSAEALRAQQAAAQAQALLGQAEAALGARQYDAAVGHLDGALRLEPGNARATSLRADAVRRRDLARRRFAAGQTAVQSGKAQKASDLAGFDTGDADLRKAPDFLGRVEFEMSPASGIEAGDAWTLRVYVVNEGKKPIRIQGVTVGTTVNGSGTGGPVPPRAREVAPQQRALVAETTGSWREGTTAWAAEATVTAGKGESLRNTLTWR